MARRERRRPWVAVPVGFQREWALSDAQLAAYIGLSELALERFADRTEGRFVCSGSDLAGWGQQAAGAVANALRRYRTLPRELVTIEKHPERRRVWIVTLHHFAAIQGLEAASSRRARPRREGSGDALAMRWQAPGDALASAWQVPGLPAEGGPTHRNVNDSEGVRCAPPPRPRPNPRPPPRAQPEDALSRARRPDASDLPADLPAELEGFVVSSRRWLSPNVAALLEAGDREWLAAEWELFRRHHVRAGTKIRSLEALFRTWLRNPQTGERAHERRKAQTEAIAQGQLRMGPERIVRGGRRRC